MVKKDGLVFEKNKNINKKHNIIMNDFKDIKNSSSQNRLRRSEHSHAIVSAPSCDSCRCNPRKGRET